MKETQNNHIIIFNLGSVLLKILLKEEFNLIIMKGMSLSHKIFVLKLKNIQNLLKLKVGITTDIESHFLLTCIIVIQNLANYRANQNKFNKYSLIQYHSVYKQ